MTVAGGLLLLGVRLGGCAPARPDGSPVAVGTVLFARGTAEVEGPGRAPGETVGLGSVLVNLDRLSVTSGKGAAIALSVKDGPQGVLILGPGASLRLWDIPSQGADFIPLKPALASKLVEGAEGWGGPREGRPSYRDPVPGGAELLSPRRYVLARRPTFHLRIPEEADRCEVTVNAMVGMGPMVLFRFVPDGPETPYPEGEEDLAGGSLVWMEVVTYRGGEPWATTHPEFVPAHKFVVAELAELQEVLKPLRRRDPLAASCAEALFMSRREMYEGAALALRDALRIVPEDRGLLARLDWILAEGLQLSEAGAREFKDRFGG